MDSSTVGDTYNAHAFPGCDKSCHANDETNSREDPPASTSAAESNKNCGNDSTNDTANPKASSEDHTRTVAIADCPADKVWMGLVAERPFDCVYDVTEGRWVGCNGQSVKEACTFLGRKVELTRSSICYIDRDDA